MKASQTLGRQRTAFDKDLLFNGRLPNADDSMWTVDWRDYDLPYCSIYIITPDNEWPCKIGISVSPRKRLMGLQTSVWRPLHVAKCFWAPSVLDARAIEQRVHQALTDENKWLHGEWFDMRPSEASEMVQFSAMVAGLECNDKVEDQAVAEAVKDYVFRETQKRSIKRIDMREFNKG